MEYKTAKNLKAEKSPTITTGITALDKCLRGGIRPGKVYELVGKPGTGKTQLCMKLCLNVQIPRYACGLASKALYFDTRKDFNPARLKELADDLAARLRCTSISAPTATQMLQNVYYVDCRNTAQLVAGLLNCHKYLEKEPNIKLIIVDSISFAIRMVNNVSDRTELLMEVHDGMRKLQLMHDLAFVITNNQGYRRRMSQFQLEAVLGRKHSQLINKRIWLTENECFVGKRAKTKRLICKLLKYTL
ncbi:DNA repair protein RAD51 homolog 3 isoform X1 [Drosophila virilis]|uniref:DNA repair protein RAD51 homolog 3 n=2 Tax=Drosophila virilis TaxID=7244 RepID=B4MB38_DROVI|nr:DNA repair protein RAD51 homolog 3 isoform X1 [Drosophila virilis]EDW66447.1 uncharacterized protein Dvir_GJ16038, isoform A [Drosophila virilis]